VERTAHRNQGGDGSLRARNRNSEYTKRVPWRGLRHSPIKRIYQNSFMKKITSGALPERNDRTHSELVKKVNMGLEKRERYPFRGTLKSAGMKVESTM